jgi:hypothetical protein
MTATHQVDKTCMSFWFPKLEAARLPVPRTTLVSMSDEALRDVFRVFDGEEMHGDAEPFFNALGDASDSIGYPCFLRTGQTSGKHQWRETCYLPSRDDIQAHVISLIEFSECVQIIGLPCNVWAVRELLPTLPLGTCPNYEGMPLCREFRFFVADGEVKCWHHYWPLGAIEQGGGNVALYDQLCAMDGYEEAFSLAHKTARVIEGAWSVDILETRNGWYVTDMAEAFKSYHEPGCKENGNE